MHSASIAQLAEDSILGPHLRLAHPPGTDNSTVGTGAVFFTGATGNLGRLLCVEMLRRTAVQVYCLVRAGGGDSADARLRRVLVASGASPHDLWRVTAVPGDLTRPLLGLSVERFATLARRLDEVYHCGADVRLGGSYARLRAANVSGTTEVLRLAMAGRPSRLHHVSTLSVFLAARSHDHAVVSECDEPELSHAGQVGYAQTKSVAERLLRQARERGVPVTVYRLPLLIAHARTGVCGANDYLAALIRACIQLRAAPGGDLALPVCSVDRAAAAIVSLAAWPPAGHTGEPGGNLHVLDRRPLLLSRVAARARHAGYRIEDVPVRRWRELVTEHRRHTAVRAMWALDAVSDHLLPISARAALPQVDSTMTHRALAGRGLGASAVDDAVLDRMIAYLREIRKLPETTKAEVCG